MGIAHAVRKACKRWFLLVTSSEAESESETEGALRSSVNQKTESQSESEARRNRDRKDQKVSFFFRFCFGFRRLLSAFVVLISTRSYGFCDFDSAYVASGNQALRASLSRKLRAKKTLRKKKYIYMRGRYFCET